MKLSFSLPLLLLLFSSLVLADIKSELKGTGKQLANYQACAKVAKNINDPALFHYYNDMFEDSAEAIRFYPLNHSEIVFKAFFQGKILLAELDSTSFASLCLSRFDSLSRKMQEAKLASKEDK